MIVSERGFASGGDVTLIGSEDGTVLAQATADSVSRFNAEVTVPQVAPGDNEIVVTPGNGSLATESSLVKGDGSTDRDINDHHHKYGHTDTYR